MSDLRTRLIGELKSIFDPEIPVNIYDLGLIYDLTTSESSTGVVVNVRMSLTSPNCPVADKLPEQVRNRLASVPGADDVHVALVWDPPWTPERMSEMARLELELRGVNIKAPHEPATKMTNLSIGRTNRSRM